MARQLHPVRADLSGDGDQRRTVQISICYTGNKVGRARAKGRQADTCTSGQTAIDICHKCRALLMAHRDEPDMAVTDGEHQIERFLARNTKHYIDAFGLETIHKHLRRGFCCFLHLSYPPYKRKRAT